MNFEMQTTMEMTMETRMEMTMTMKCAISLAMIGLLTACGGELELEAEPGDAPQTIEASAVALDDRAEAPAAAPPTDAADEPSADTLEFRPLSGHSTELEEAEFARLINEERRRAGLPALLSYWDLVDDARAHSRLMDQTNDLHHNPALKEVTQPGYWARLGENVGRGFDVGGLHRAFMNSTGHRENILGDFTHLGVGVHHADGGLWVTVVFMKAAVPGLHDTFGPFTDDDFTVHEANIHKIWKAGLTYGCGGQSYCPDRSLTRGEMAAFLTRALALTPAPADHFDDDDGAWYEASANAMYASGVTVGCGERAYCGADPVTRGQMAAFLTRAFELPPSSTDYFRDDDGRYYETSANAIREAGYTHGCGEARFCGERSLTRGEMASFLARALRL